MRHLWRIGSDTPDYTAEEMNGLGAEKTGGRWNRKGIPVLYTASNIALAALETVVHLGAGSLPLNRYLVRFDVPEEIWAKRVVCDPITSFVGWDSRPPGRVSLDFGDEWLQSLSSALCAVPSVIVPEEMNVLINPRHPDANKISAIKLRLWMYDERMR